MKEENLFRTEQDVADFLKLGRRRTDYGIDSLLTFPYATDEVRALACAFITEYLEDQLGSHAPLEVLGRYIQRIAPFLEASGYTAAIEPLMRIRNKLEARSDYGVTGTYGYESTVAVRNAIEMLQRVRNSPAA